MHARRRALAVRDGVKGMFFVDGFISYHSFAERRNRKHARISPSLNLGVVWFYFGHVDRSRKNCCHSTERTARKQRNLHLYLTPPDGGGHHVLFDVRTVIGDVSFRHDAARRSQATTSLDDTWVCQEKKLDEPRTTKRGEQRVVINIVVRKRRRRKRSGLE